MCRNNGECAVIDYMILVLLYKTMFLFKFINCYYNTSCYHSFYLKSMHAWWILTHTMLYML